LADVTAKVWICVAIFITLAQLVIDLLYFLLPDIDIYIFNLIITEERAMTLFWSAVAAETVVLFVVVVVAFVVVVVVALVVVVFFVVVVIGFWVVIVIEQFKAIG
jgi:hypothetical protein